MVLCLTFGCLFLMRNEACLTGFSVCLAREGADKSRGMITPLITGITDFSKYDRQSQPDKRKKKTTHTSPTCLSRLRKLWRLQHPYLNTSNSHIRTCLFITTKFNEPHSLCCVNLLLAALTVNRGHHFKINIHLRSDDCISENVLH